MTMFQPTSQTTYPNVLKPFFDEFFSFLQDDGCNFLRTYTFCLKWDTFCRQILYNTITDDKQVRMEELASAINSVDFFISLFSSFPMIPMAQFVLKCAPYIYIYIVTPSRQNGTFSFPTLAILLINSFHHCSQAGLLIRQKWFISGHHNHREELDILVFLT